MGCCESNRILENEVIFTEKPMRESDFYDINLESPGEFKGFYVEGIHSSKSTCPTSRFDVNFMNTGFVNNAPG
ncbi:hypothetical protein SteCoe_35294 [Stentor coeruleus]|uniref:Uncharacterized protein n=1 Tax=Stentor coeruleus TaxID=5963 RepID=A0A1R2ASP4_9CILI|nr:hypothetical protein SteCoe_35294 [Stentor coeruleus]